MSSTILVTGAGLAGLVTATALLENGVSVRIIDKNTSHNVAHRGSGTTPRTMEGHKFLGTYEAVGAISQGFPGMALYKVPGGTEVFKEVNIGPSVEPSPSVPFPSGLMIPQYEHEGALRGHLKTKFGISVELGTELLSYEQSHDKVIVKLRKSDGSEETSNFAYLVGADGGRSTVRKQCKEMSFLGEIRGQESMVVGDIVVKEGLSPSKWHCWGQMGVKMFMLGRSTGDHYYAFVSGADFDKPHLSSSRENLIEGFYNFTGRTDVKFGELITLAHFTPNIRMVDKFRVGRVLVTGDAAHVHSPTGGQGLNSGIIDSINLGWKLALVHKGLAPDDLLETFTEERLPVIREMLQRTTALLAKSHAVGEQTRQKPLEASSDLVRAQSMAQLSVNYIGSSITVDELKSYQDKLENVSSYELGDIGRLVAGQRAPDAPAMVNLQNKESGSLFDHFSVKHHTILLFGQDDAKALSVMKVVAEYMDSLVKTISILPAGSLPSDKMTELEDKDGHAYHAYEVPTGVFRAAIIRPDGVIGAIVESGGEGVQKYFKGIFN